MNLLGAGLIVKYGLPKEIPFVRREDADPLIGYLGLLLFGTSIGLRVILNISA